MTMRRLPAFLLLLLAAASQAQAALYVTIVQGLGGDDLWTARFNEQRHRIEEASATLADADHLAVFSGEDATRDNLLAHFGRLDTAMSDDDRAAIYLIGHGSYDGEQYKFNIPGPDITDKDLADILAALPGRNHFLVNTSSASGAMLDSVASDRVIVMSATRNGNEKNATEFGAFFADALVSESADINKNNAVSIQEAFDFAERGVTGFFERDGKLATEHPQMRGEGASSFSIARLQEADTGDNDPRVSALLSRRQELDNQIEELQLRRGEYSNADYIQRLQALILESAGVSEQIDALREGNGANGD